MAMSEKNMALSPAVADLGLGDMLKSQTEDEVLQRRKKLMSAADTLDPTGAGAGISPATMSLLGNMNAQ